MTPHFSSPDPQGARQVERPAELLDHEFDPVRLLLEQLDDTVFAALSGCDDSLERTRELWPQVVEALGWELVDESREQYLRFAVETTQRLQEEEVRTPERSVAALEVIALLAK